MAKAATDIRSLARSHTATAINTLVGIMRQAKAPAAARVAAAQALLDRGYGKPSQSMELTGKDGQPLVQPTINVQLSEPGPTPAPKASNGASHKSH